MAVTFKAEGNYGYKIMGLFGVSGVLMANAQSSGVTVEQSYPGTFNVSMSGKVFGSIVIKGQAISMVKAGTLGPSSKQTVAAQFEMALKKALQSVESVVPSAPAPSLIIPSTISKEFVSSITGVSVSSTDQKAPASPAEKSPIALKSVVKGTSPGSVYKVFATFKGGFALACRAKNGVLSVRSVGDSAATFYQNPLKEMGFSSKNAGGVAYLSAHFSCGDETLMCKTLGAVVGGLGFQRVLGVVDLKEVM